MAKDRRGPFFIDSPRSNGRQTPQWSPARSRSVAAAVRGAGLRPAVPLSTSNIVMATRKKNPAAVALGVRAARRVAQPGPRNSLRNNRAKAPETQCGPDGRKPRKASPAGILDHLILDADAVRDPVVNARTSLPAQRLILRNSAFATRVRPTGCTFGSATHPRFLSRLHPSVIPRCGCGRGPFTRLRNLTTLDSSTTSPIP